MGEVRWIKITTNIFDDEKIRFIETMPDSDSVLVIWFKLLALAGKSNREGYIMLTESIPYTQKMLVSYLNRKETVVQMAMETFEKLDMISVTDEQAILISNWSKHQNVAGLDKIKEQNRIRKQKQRDKERQKLIENQPMSRDMSRDVTEQNKNKNKNKKKELEDKEEKPGPLETALKEFYEFRKSVKAPMTEKAKELLKNRLDKLTPVEGLQIKIIEQSIMNGWKSVYELKEKPDLRTRSKLKQGQTPEEKGVGHNL